VQLVSESVHIEPCLTCTRASTLLGFATDYHGSGHAHHRSRNDKIRKKGRDILLLRYLLVL